MTPQELAGFEKLGNGRAPFCAVVVLKERLTVVGSAELLAAVLPKHSPTSILPSDWGRDYGNDAGYFLARNPTQGPLAHRP